MYLMPVLPFLTDTEQMLERTVERAVEAGVGFIVFGGLTLRPGRQQEHFLSVLRGIRPDRLGGGHADRLDRLLAVAAVPASRRLGPRFQTPLPGDL